MIKSMLFLISLLFMLPCMSASAVASGSSSTHPHTNALELKPASLDNSYQTASVCFMGFGDCDPNASFGKGDDYEVSTENQCTNEGFTKPNCSSVQIIDGVCPYNPAYGKGCKCRPGLVSCAGGQVGVGTACNGQYASCQCKSTLVACASNQNGTGNTCGGKYEACVCKPEYQYNSSNCTSPRSIGGSSCGGKYTNCTCPGGVSTGAYGCKSYYGSPCSSVCQEAYSDNCRNRSSVATPYGCISYFADCGSACERAYGDNCRNRTAATCPNGCAENWADCSSKCQTCKEDPCTNRTAVATPYGCQTYFADCSSKCQVAKGNPDCDVTSQSCPNGCQTTNSCGKCTSCKGNPDCDVTSQTCPNGCQTTNSCGKCTSCKPNISCSQGGYESNLPGFNTCDKVTYQGLSCYTNCKRPVSVYEVWPDGNIVCAGGPYISPKYKKPGDDFNTGFPRSTCSSQTMDKTTTIVPIGSQLKLPISAYSANGKNYKLCKISRGSPNAVSANLSCSLSLDNGYGECTTTITNLDTGSSHYHDYYVIWQDTYGNPTVNGQNIFCEYL